MNNLKKVWVWLGETTLRIILIIGMIVVFCGGVYLSWQHTYKMADRHGFAPDEAIVYTFVVETLLIAAELVVIFLATMGRRINVAVYVGVGITAIINLVGNVSSFWDVSAWGVALGASITVITAVAVWIFATTLTDTTVTTNQRHTDKDTIDKDTIDKDTTTNVEIDKDRQDTTTPIVLDPTDRSADTLPRQIVRQELSVVDNTVDEAKTVYKTDKTKTDKTVDETKTVYKTDKTPTTVDKTLATLSVIQGGKTDEDEEAARQLALDYYDTHGKYPSYRQLGELSGIGKDRAGKVIKQLKTKAV